MRISKLWPGFAIAATLVVTGCGGGSSTPAPAATATPTPAATATATPTPPPPGPLLVGYTLSNGGGTVAGSATPATAAFVAISQTAAVTATQANYTGSFTAVAGAGCGTNVTVAPASSATGSFTVTAVGAVASGCTITFTGAAATATVPLSATVPAPGGVKLQWVANAALATQPAPIAPLAGPVNLIGVTSTFGAVLVVSETHYLGAFNAPVLSGACGANLSAPVTSTNANLANITQPSTALGQSQVYYDESAPSTAVAFTLASGCTVTVTDKQTTPSSASMGVVLTTSSGGIL